MSIIKQLQDQAEEYQMMKAEFDKLTTRINNQTGWFNRLDPRGFGYKPADEPIMTALKGPDSLAPAQHLGYHRSDTREWNALGNGKREYFEAARHDIDQLEEMLIRRRYYLQNLDDKLKMLRKLNDIRDILGFVGAT